MGEKKNHGAGLWGRKKGALSAMSFFPPPDIFSEAYDLKQGSQSHSPESLGVIGQVQHEVMSPITGQTLDQGSWVNYLTMGRFQ
ncbi:hypothetical protein H920_07293 [Fukomys damarensis]|uniref:Uncharacterized protein n=1 Tax=Fukomys damarensis TaxID=885580 RepID=A0A091DJP7_FUKDA|nr:hypothetical protein H920_07293 [Fukomys damarensis]